MGESKGMAVRAGVSAVVLTAALTAGAVYGDNGSLPKLPPVPTTIGVAATSGPTPAASSAAPENDGPSTSGDVSGDPGGEDDSGGSAGGNG